MMGEFLKENNISLKDGADVNVILGVDLFPKIDCIQEKSVNLMPFFDVKEIVQADVKWNGWSVFFKRKSGHSPVDASFFNSPFESVEGELCAVRGGDDVS